MNKLAKIINELNYEELTLIKKDVEEGNIETLINQRLKKMDEEKNLQVCPICNTEIKEFDATPFILYFGEKSFRRKAHFDAIDCLQYFILHLKKIHEKKIRHGDEEDGTN